ncbi:hypothetical protein [Saccharothrix sp.]|uniref:hypothetical protein n=1 Tax=Saccharothrix sp. TaxID=1873460 RepID=UPI002811256A|nr:hypothetical protein [Saccharothrix sp.]
MEDLSVSTRLFPPGKWAHLSGWTPLAAAPPAASTTISPPSSPGSTPRLATEQQLIRDATERLLVGTPHRSNGSLTIARLAAEAGVPRHRVYEHHADLVAEFKAKAHNGGPTTTDIQALQHQLADARAHIQTLEATAAQLKAKITTLCAVITELTHDTTANNVLTMPSRRHRDA